jgi:hypothetical protein
LGLQNRERFSFDLKIFFLFGLSTSLEIYAARAVRLEDGTGERPVTDNRFQGVNVAFLAGCGLSGFDDCRFAS